MINEELLQLAEPQSPIILVDSKRQEYLAMLGQILGGINALETYSEMDHKTIVTMAIEQCDLVFKMLGEREK